MLPNNLVEFVNRSMEARAQPFTEITNVQRLHELFIMTQPKEPDATESVEAISVEIASAEGR